jgi:hypothetical protein
VNIIKSDFMFTALIDWHRAPYRISSWFYRKVAYKDEPTRKWAHEKRWKVLIMIAYPVKHPN